jgi:hypothetical protein
MDKLEALRNKLIAIKEELAKTVNQDPDSSPIEVNKKDRCWDGYEPAPGKKAYSEGSCRPINKEEEMQMCDNGQWKLNKIRRGGSPDSGKSVRMDNAHGRPYSGVGGSSKQQLFHQEKELKIKNSQQPVKTFSPEEKAKLAEQMGLKKT